MKPVCVGLLLALMAPASWGLNLWGVDVDGVEFQSSLLQILDSVNDGAPDPVVNTIGISVPLRIVDRWYARPELQLFFLGYKYAGDRAVPESSEWDNVVEMSIMVNPIAGYDFPLTRDLVASAEGGLGILLRFPVFLNGATAADMALPATSWLLAGRFIYPNVGGALTWKISPKISAVLRGQLYYPLFDLWSGVPLYDEVTYGVGIGIRYTF